MVEKRHLSKAPIKEAIIDIRVISESVISIESYQDEFDVISKDYPQHDWLSKGRVEFYSSKEEVSQRTVNEGIYALKCIHKDGHYIGQFKTEGFSFSRLEPYEDWYKFRDEAYRLWQIYKDIIKPVGISRIATRYVNGIPIQNTELINEYLDAPPSVPTETSSPLNSFLTRTVFNDADSNADVVLTQAMNPLIEDYTEIIIDIDAYFVKDYDIADSKYLDDFEVLRDLKNRIFFQSITEKAVEIFL